MISNAVIDRRGPISLDQWSLIEGEILARFSRRIQDFHISIVDDGLLLEGRTSFYYIKQEAKQVLMKMTRLHISANMITVNSSID